MKVVCINNRDIPGWKDLGGEKTEWTYIEIPENEISDDDRSYDISNSIYLTVGKSYEINSVGSYSYILYNDIGVCSQYSKVRFITLEEYREQTLNELEV